MPSLCAGAARRDLERLAKCLHRAVAILQAEPAADERLADFVKRPLSRGGDGGRDDYVATCGWLQRRDLGAVELSREPVSWDHFDDGRAVAWRRYRVRCAGTGIEATTTVELHMR